MSTLRDAQFAIRSLARSAVFTVLVVLTLALGIGTSTAVFSVVNAVILRPLEYPEPQQLVRITSDLRGYGATDAGVSPAELVDYQARTDLFRDVSGVLPLSANVTSGAQPARVEMLHVSWSYFSILGVPPAQGRVFGPEDDVPGVGSVAVVSHAFWQRNLGGDPNAIGRSIVIDADPVLVVGVMPASFRHPGRTLQNDVEVWSPSGFRGSAAAPLSRARRRIENCLARLQPGVTLEQAQRRLAEYGVAVSQQFPSDYPARTGWMPRVASLHESVVGGMSGAMFMLMSGVGLLLLIACVNVAHLVLARSAARRHEIAVRKALGARVGQLVRQLTIESAMLAAAGGVLGLLVASWVASGLVALAPGRVPRIDRVTIDLTAVLVAAGIVFAATVLFGLVPAWQLRRVETVSAMKDGGPARGSDGRSGRARDLLVAAEVAMATVLLIGAGLLIRSLVVLMNVPLGFDSESLLTARISLPRPNDATRAAYLDPTRRVAFSRETLARIQALPDVERAAVSTQVPLGGFNAPLIAEIQGFDSGDQTLRPVLHSFQVSPSYFETMRVRILKGRPFTDADRTGSEPVAIVSETAARSFWKGRDPIGERLRLGPDQPWMTVIGVAGDVLSRRMTDQAQPILYQPFEQASGLSLALLVRYRAATADLGERVAREVRAVDPDLPVFSVRSMDDVIAYALAQRQYLMRLAVAFGAIATALALLGIYGVMSYAVARRTREIGIRMAIGARQADMSRMVLRRAVALTIAGAFTGGIASWVLSGLIRSQLFGVEPSDPVTIGSVFVVMAIVACAAGYLPARRAAHVDPVVALRSQ